LVLRHEYDGQSDDYVLGWMEWEVWDFITLFRTLKVKTYRLFISRTFQFLDHGWPQVNEIVEIKTADKSGLLYPTFIQRMLGILIVHSHMKNDGISPQFFLDIICDSSSTLSYVFIIDCVTEDWAKMEHRTSKKGH
jgi:hypothetical protein